MRTADAVIIGGGIIGCAAAYYLSAHGVRPLLLERGELGAEASGANPGIVGASIGVPGLTLGHTRKSMELLARDAEALGRPLELVRDGWLMVACTEADRSAVEEFAAARRSEGLDVRLLSGDEVHDLVPALGPAVLGAAYTPEDGHVNPFLLTHAYAAGARHNGAEIEQGVDVTRLEVSRDRGVGVVARGEQITAPLVILAAGAWSAALLVPIGVTLPVRPGRGQMMVTAAVPPITARVLLSPLLVDLVQDARGHVLIGSSVEDVGFDRSVTLETLAEFSRSAMTIVPALREAHVIRTWAGLRPMTPDALPIIDRAPGISGLILATGHSRAGVAYAPVTGWLLAQMVTRSTTELPLDPFRLGRFAGVAPHSGVTALSEPR